MEATNFQDLGVKNRHPVLPPQYVTTKDFLNDTESSDEEIHINIRNVLQKKDQDKSV